jgi:hypothetical protein
LIRYRQRVGQPALPRCDGCPEGQVHGCGPGGADSIGRSQGTGEGAFGVGEALGVEGGDR